MVGTRRLHGLFPSSRKAAAGRRTLRECRSATADLSFRRDLFRVGACALGLFWILRRLFLQKLFLRISIAFCCSTTVDFNFNTSQLPPLSRRT